MLILQSIRKWCLVIDIEHADIVVDKQTTVYREVVAAECRHDVPYARCDFAAAVNGRGRIERSESGDFVDESVVLKPLLVDDIAALGGAGELAHSDCARSEEPIYIAVYRAVSAVRIALGRAARIGEIIPPAGLLGTGSRGSYRVNCKAHVWPIHVRHQPH